ncbi:putative small ubiquitin-related modifier 7 [Triticum aestivum]|uniref:putative small ubiquitin-related modifier 7 n=1 Tax=Triticum aestivum TaxID=4565 RepID=UPI001D0115D2|nr:putative small ubiquitin-related modifier 7 [Triticum aestivum]
MASPARDEEEEEESKPAVAPLFVTLKVVDQKQNLVRHAIRTTDKLQAVMDMYYSKVPGVEYGTGTFHFDAVRVVGWRTPAELQMEDGDVIDFFEQQIPAGRWLLFYGALFLRIVGSGQCMFFFSNAGTGSPSLAGERVPFSRSPGRPTAGDVGSG